MVKKSSGKISKRSRKLGASAERMTPAKLVRAYNVGDSVAITPHPRYDGMPHPRYRGRIGKIISKRGNAYEVKVKLGNSCKTLVASSMHLKKSS